MYDKKVHGWRSDCEKEEILRWCKEPANENKPEAQFLRASELLSRVNRGGEVAEAVALMEQSAKNEYAPAMFAMGQMFEWGWGVHRDKKRAKEWYHAAAKIGYQPAQQLLAKAKRMRIIEIVIVCIIIILGILCIFNFNWIMDRLSGKTIIRIHEDTELQETTTLEEFNEEVQELIAQYDDELVISGQISTNRVILKFEGKRLDLSDYLADRVIARENNLAVIQFSTEEEAKRCLEELSKLENIQFVEMDEYSIRSDSNTLPLQPPKVTTTDPQNGYYSWGVLDMGLDKLSEYVAQNHNSEDILVAVIDSGVQVFNSTKDRIVGAINIVTGGDVVPGDHGTHVAGTVLDGTRGTNTYVLSVDVFNGYEGASDLAIASGIEFAVQEGADVLNMSLGGPGRSETLRNAILDAIAAGAIVVVAAGNDAENAINYSPAGFEACIVVGAYDINHDIAEFSNYGESVDVCAPGVEIFSNYYLDANKLIEKDGTSMASPHVAALAALLRHIYPGIPQEQMELYITDYCRVNVNLPAYSTGNYGAGAPNGYAYIEVY